MHYKSAFYLLNFFAYTVSLADGSMCWGTLWWWCCHGNQTLTRLRISCHHLPSNQIPPIACRQMLLLS